MPEEIPAATAFVDVAWLVVSLAGMEGESVPVDVLRAHLAHQLKRSEGQVDWLVGEAIAWGFVAETETQPVLTDKGRRLAEDVAGAMVKTVGRGVEHFRDFRDYIPRG